MGTERCDKCGKEYAIGDWPLCPHGKFSADRLGLIDDSWPGGKTFENMGPEPVTCYSRSEWRKEMKRRGLANNVRHVPVPGSDKSPATSRWI